MQEDTEIMKTVMMLIMAMTISQEVTARDPRLSGAPPAQRTEEMPCYITEQSVKGTVRTCIWQCRDRSIESVTTPKQFQCPSTLFKRIPLK